MGNAAPRSVRAAAAENETWDAATVAERQRTFEFLDSIDPGRSFRWIQHAWLMYKLGGGVERARPVFRAALARVAEYEAVYSAWTNMEQKEGFTVAARELYEEWRARRAGVPEEDFDVDMLFAEGDHLLWRKYLDFELDHGDAERARAVAEAAVAACPGDVKLRAECVLAEAQLGDEERARAAFDRALSAFAADPDTARRLTEEVRKGCTNLSNKRFAGCLLFCCGRCFFRPMMWWEQI